MTENPEAEYKLSEVGLAERRAYTEALEQPIDELAGQTLQLVGQRITAVGAGVSDARVVRRWAEGRQIRQENEVKLRLLYRVARSVQLIYDEQTARAFLCSSSPFLGDQAPLRLIAENREVEVIGATRAFLKG